MNKPTRKELEEENKLLKRDNSFKRDYISNLNNKRKQERSIMKHEIKVLIHIIKTFTEDSYEKKNVFGDYDNNGNGYLTELFNDNL